MQNSESRTTEKTGISDDTAPAIAASRHKKIPKTSQNVSRDDPPLLLKRPQFRKYPADSARSRLLPPKFLQADTADFTFAYSVSQNLTSPASQVRHSGCHPHQYQPCEILAKASQTPGLFRTAQRLPAERSHPKDASDSPSVNRLCTALMPGLAGNCLSIPGKVFGRN